MIAPLRDWVSIRLTPSHTLEARVRIEQLRAIAGTNLKAAPFYAVLTVLLILFDLQWASFALVAIWAPAALGALGWMYWGSRKAVERQVTPSDAGPFTADVILWTAPFMIVWPTMVLFVWLPGNALNNGFLVTFLFASMAAMAPQTGVSRYVALPGILVDLPLLATHTLTGFAWMDWLAPILQTLAAILICYLSFAFERFYRSVALERFEKEALAQELSNTARDLGAARDSAQRASKAKSEFLANMSHELRTPLNAIIGFADLMRSKALGPLQPEKYTGYVDDIHRSGLYLLNLINNLLDLAKIEAGKHEMWDSQIDLEQAAASALRFVEMQARKGSISLRSEVESGARLIADERALTQVLTNLLSNAVKFTEPGGSVAIFAHRLSNGALAIGVKDSGIGMEPQDVERALEPFVQVAHLATVEGWGSGLGMPLTKSLIEAHNGTFYIESHRGIGTCAWGEFPAERTLLHDPTEMAIA